MSWPAGSSLSSSLAVKSLSGRASTKAPPRISLKLSVVAISICIQVIDVVEPNGADQDEIDRDHIVQQSRHEQNQDAASDSSERQDVMGDGAQSHGRIISPSVEFPARQLVVRQRHHVMGFSPCSLV